MWIVLEILMRLLITVATSWLSDKLLEKSFRIFLSIIMVSCQDSKYIQI